MLLGFPFRSFVSFFPVRYCYHDISWTILIKLTGNSHEPLLMTWLDSGGQRSKVKVTTGYWGHIYELFEQYRWNLQGIATWWCWWSRGRLWSLLIRKLVVYCVMFTCDAGLHTSGGVKHWMLCSAFRTQCKTGAACWRTQSTCRPIYSRDVVCGAVCWPQSSAPTWHSMFCSLRSHLRCDVMSCGMIWYNAIWYHVFNVH